MLFNKGAGIISLFIVVLGYNSVFGQQLVYQAINPAFGGNPMNYSWLLNSAQVQNPYKDNATDLSSLNSDPLKDFKQTLQRQILSELSQKLVAGQLGDLNLSTQGSYDLGDYTVNINPGTSGLSVTIFDKISGQETNVTIPYL
jgi:curli production assembly/transport component CsgF